MKQETLKEAAWRVLGKFEDNFYDGAKWQQEKLCNSEVIQKIRASKSDDEARRIIRTI